MAKIFTFKIFDQLEYQGLSKDIGNSFAYCSEVVSFQPEAKKIAYISMGTQLGMFTGEVKNKKRWARSIWRIMSKKDNTDNGHYNME